MRLCILTPEYDGITPQQGGIATHFAALAPELARRGHEIVVLTVPNGSSGPSTREGVRIEYLPRVRTGPAYPVYDLALAAAAPRALHRLGPFDVVFAPEWRGLAAGCARGGREFRLVTNLATSLRQEQSVAQPPDVPLRRRLQHQLQHRMERRQAERSDGIVACTSAVLRWARELWDLDSVGTADVVPNFIDVDAIRRAGDGDLPAWFPREAPTILYFGRLQERKGVHVLAAAMDDVWRDFPDAQLILAGSDWPYRGRTMAEHVREVTGDSPNVHITGPVPREALMPVVRAADVVVFPSLWENFSIATLEARALGRATVATAGVGFDDFVRDGEDGLLVERDSAPALAAAVTRLLGDDALRRRVGDAAASSADRYSTSVVGEELAAWFERVAA